MRCARLQMSSVLLIEHESKVEDLTRLMRVYNFWAHRLYPKVKFRDTVVRVEKLCHSKRMHASISQSVLHTLSLMSFCGRLHYQYGETKRRVKYEIRMRTSPLIQTMMKEG
jgi:hypothetical protein